MPSASPSRPVLIRGGHLTRLDQPGWAGDVLLRDGRIAAISDRIDPTGEEDVIEAAGHLVLPGFVDTHRHLWLGALSASSSGVTLPGYAAEVNERAGDPFTTEDVYAGVLWGALQAINAGVTTVADWAHNLDTEEDIAANLRALHDSGIRARFFFGGKASSSGDQNQYIAQARALPALHAGNGRSKRITLGLALRGPSMSTLEETATDFTLARELMLPISIHAGMAGMSGTIRQLDAQGLLGPDVNYAHANEFTPQEWDLVADSGGTVSATATVEVTMGLGTQTAVGAALEHGVPIGFGSDTVAYGPTDLFGEMRLALALERARTNRPVIARGEMPTELASSHAQMLQIATRGGAEALGLPDVGTLSIGSVADVITIDLTPIHLDGFGDPSLTAFLGAGPRDVATVAIAGRILKRDGRIDVSLYDRARDLIRDSRTRIRSRTR